MDSIIELDHQNILTGHLRIIPCNKNPGLHLVVSTKDSSMSMKNCIIAIAFACAPVTSGCATLFKSKTAEVRVSTAAGGDVFVDGESKGAAPMNVVLSNKTDHVIKVGEKTCEVKAGASTGWVVLSVLAGGVGWIVDWVTGNWKSLDQTECKL
jgi:hypothetical protein